MRHLLRTLLPPLLLIVCTPSFAKVNYIKTCFENFHHLILVETPKQDLSKTVLVRPGALATQIRNYRHFRNQMFQMRPSINKFKARYQQQHGRLPTLEEALNFQVRAKTKLAAHIRSAKNGNEDLDYFLEVAARSIDNRAQHIKALENFKIKHPDILKQEVDLQSKEQLPLIYKMDIFGYKGPLGELDAILTLEHVVAQSVFFNEMNSPHQGTQRVNDIFYSALFKRYENLQESEWPQLLKSYPHIFRKTNEDMTLEQAINRGLDIVMSKEVDIVIEKGDKFEIVEIKNYKGGLSARKVQEREEQNRNSRNKRVLSQLLEVREIIHFLNLQDQFTVGLMSMQGMTEQAKNILLENGITVYGKILTDNIHP